jgi:hypothetical protein
MQGFLGSRNQNRSRKNNSGTGVWTLGRNVFTRSRFHAGGTYEWTHAVQINGHTVRRVVPVQQHSQRYTDAGNPLGKV